MSDLEREVEAIFEEYGGGLFDYAGSMLRSGLNAQDAVQECFLRYFVERSCGRSIDNPKAWLYRVLRNYLLDRLDRAAAKCEVPTEEAMDTPDGRQGPEARLQRAQIAGQITSVLTAREVECLRLRAEGQSYEEISATLGIAPGTVGALLTRVHQKLRKAGHCEPGRQPETGGALYDLFLGEPNAP